MRSPHKPVSRILSPEPEGHSLNVSGSSGSYAAGNEVFGMLHFCFVLLDSCGFPFSIRRFEQILDFLYQPIGVSSVSTCSS
jgi:hypothetical protein